MYLCLEAILQMIYTENYYSANVLELRLVLPIVLGYVSIFSFQRLYNSTQYRTRVYAVCTMHQAAHTQG